MNHSKHHSDCDVVILVGGKGTRLKEVVSDVPKPMAMVQDKPFLDILIQQFSEQGFRRFILCTGHLSDVIHDHYQKPEFADLDIVFSEEKEPLGTGGAIQNALAHVKSDPFIALNGDCFCPIDFKAMFDFHQSKQSAVTIASAHVNDGSRFGTLEIGPNNELNAFKEKQPIHEPAEINSGVYMLTQGIYEHDPIKALPAKYSIEHDFFPQIIEDGLPIFAYHSGFEHFVDIGTPETYLSVKESGFKAS